MTLLHLLVLLCPTILVLAEREYSEEAWNYAAKYLKQAMNKNAKPCEDFYEHVCGKYGTNNETQFETTLAGKASAVATVLAKAIRGINAQSADTPRYQKAVKVFYDKCTSVEMDASWPKRLYNAIAKRIGELPLFARVKQGGTNATNQPTPMDIWFLMGKTERELGEAVMIEADLDFVEVGCERKPELQIQPKVPPDDESSELNITEIQVKVQKLAHNLGLDAHGVQSLIYPWLNKTYTLFNEWKNLSSLGGTGERIALSNLSNAIPGFNWREYFRGLLSENVRQHLEANPNTKVYVTNKELLEAIGEMLKRHSPETIKSLVFLRVVYSIQEEYFGEMDSDQLQLVSGGTAHERCLEYALRHLAPAMARLYFDTIGVDILKWRHEIQMLGRNIFSAFRFLLNSVDWLDSEDKEKIQQKVDNIVFNPGIPSWIGNENKVMNRIIVYNTSLDPFENEFAAAKKMVDRALNTLVPDEDEEDEIEAEPDPSFEVNAEYDSDSNQINMFLGLMVPPLFNLSYPLPVKYGGLGVVIGHELMHAFDADGIYAGISDDHEWLKDEAFREFAKKKNCLVRQYSRYCDRTKGLCVSGEKTIGENIADIDGIKVAYTAYKILTQVVGVDPPIPGMIHYTDDQIFFMSFARTWCSKGSLTWADLQDVHTPSKPRVEVALRNVPLFAGAFKCAVGSKYAPQSRGCSLWGDLEEPVRRRRLANDQKQG